MNNVNEYMENLYQTVDNRDLKSLASFLHDDVSFCFSNSKPVTGKNAVLDINSQFFLILSPICLIP